MTRMEDPIFDPWSIAESEAEPTPVPRAPRWRSLLGTEGVPVSRPVPLLLTTGAPTAAEEKLPDPTPPPLLSRSAQDFRAVVMPPLEVLIRRLNMARHRTTVDDRLDRSPASIRLKVDPWRAPFDEREPVSGAVLEILEEEGEGSGIVGRLWLDPLSEVPTEQSRVQFEKLTGEWVEQLMLELVRRTLRAV